MDLKRTA
jgi:hypothetical protein